MNSHLRGCPQGAKKCFSQNEKEKEEEEAEEAFILCVASLGVSSLWSGTGKPRASEEVAGLCGGVVWLMR